MFNWCYENVFGIKFFHVTTTEVQAHTELFKLEERYNLSQTIPGTRSFHSFIPFGVSDLRVRRISFDEHYLTLKYGAKTASSTLQVAPGQFHACIYDGNWCIGNAIEVSHENEDVYFQFMRRSAIINFSWPPRDDFCWVPITHVLCSIEPLELQSHGGRQYRIEIKNIRKIESLFRQFR